MHDYLSLKSQAHKEAHSLIDVCCHQAIVSSEEKVPPCFKSSPSNNNPNGLLQKIQARINPYCIQNSNQIEDIVIDSFFSSDQQKKQTSQTQLNRKKDYLISIEQQPVTFFILSQSESTSQEKVVYEAWARGFVQSEIKPPPQQFRPALAKNKNNPLGSPKYFKYSSIKRRLRDQDRPQDSPIQIAKTQSSKFSAFVDLGFTPPYDQMEEFLRKKKQEETRKAKEEAERLKFGTRRKVDASMIESLLHKNLVFTYDSNGNLQPINQGSLNLTGCIFIDSAEPSASLLPGSQTITKPPSQKTLVSTVRRKKKSENGNATMKGTVGNTNSKIQEAEKLKKKEILNLFKEPPNKKRIQTQQGSQGLKPQLQPKRPKSTASTKMQNQHMFLRRTVFDQFMFTPTPSNKILRTPLVEVVNKELYTELRDSLFTAVSQGQKNFTIPSKKLANMLLSKHSRIDSSLQNLRKTDYLEKQTTLKQSDNLSNTRENTTPLALGSHGHRLGFESWFDNELQKSSVSQLAGKGVELNQQKLNHDEILGVQTEAPKKLGYLKKKTAEVSRERPKTREAQVRIRQTLHY